MERGGEGAVSANNDPEDRFRTLKKANAELRKERDELAALLAEWMGTPFFPELGDWVQWVEQFRPRVEEAIKACGWKHIEEAR